MLFGAVHYSAMWTTPAALVCAAALLWYWVRLGKTGVAPSRRKIRRCSAAIMLLSLPAVVVGLSFADRAAQPTLYIVTWTAVMLMMVVIIAIACLDAVNSVHLHQHQTNEAVSESTRELQREIKRRQTSRAWPDEPLNGKERHA